MSIRRPLALGIAACALTVGAMAAAHRLAHASQSPVVVQRFLLGYMDKRGRFIATSGRNATNVDRNALAMFVFSGPIDIGPNTRATLPLTLSEQAELEEKIRTDPNYDPTRDGYEPGVINRKRSEDPAAFYVATGSVSPFTISVSTGSEIADGQFFKYVRPGTKAANPARVLFNPRYRISSFNKPGEIDYNADALAANTTYSVYVDGGPTPLNPFELVTNRDGKPLASAFSTTFTTNSRYVQDFSRPEIRTFSPGDTAQNVAYDADIDLTFDEPMDVSSFVLPRFQGDDQWNMIVRYTANPINGTTLRGRNILGVVRIKPQTAGNVVQFRPLQGFGKGPYEIEVVVTNGVTDLSGNNIIRQFQFTFRTESNPNAEDFSQIDESFVNTAKRDNSFTPSGDYLAANWNTTNPPFLSQVGTTVQEVPFDVYGPRAAAPGTPGPWTGVNIWYHQPMWIQMAFPASQMGGRARTIARAYWTQGIVRGRVYPNTSIYLGHANESVDAAGFPSSGPSYSNFGDVPVLVVSPTTYRTATAPRTGTQQEFVQLPDFQSVFDYDGSRSMILDLLHNGDPASAPQFPGDDRWERWRIDNQYPINCATLRLFSNNAVQTNGWLYSVRFTYLTPGAEAQSLFYDIGRNDARLLPQQVVPTTQPQGTSVVLLWQGAKEDNNTPTIPDMTTLTGWVSDIRSLSNYRYIRFRATLNNNTHARTSPRLDIVTIPFVWK